MGDVATQTKAQYCTECNNVNAAAETESVYPYPGRSVNKPVEVRASIETATDGSDANRY
jgi:hypothetical protein